MNPRKNRKVFWEKQIVGANGVGPPPVLLFLVPSFFKPMKKKKNKKTVYPFWTPFKIPQIFKKAWNLGKTGQT